MKLKRILATILCFAMVFGTMSFNVFAATNYLTATDVFPAADADGVITLVEDITLPEDTRFSEELKINLNGKTLNLTTSVTFNGSATLYGGTINADGVSCMDGIIRADYHHTPEPAVTLTLEDVTVSAYGVEYGTGLFYVEDENDTLVLTNVDVETSGADEDPGSGVFYSPSSFSRAKVILNEGTTVTSDYSSAIFFATDVELDGATITCSNVRRPVFRQAAGTVTNSTITVNSIGDGQALVADVSGNNFGVVNFVNSTVTAPEGTPAVDFSNDGSAAKADSTSSVGDNEGVLKDEETPAVTTVATVNGVAYPDLESAIADAYTYEGNVTVILEDDFTGNIEIKEKVGLYLTLDGAGKTFDGTIKVKALSDTNDNRRTTIENVNFVSEEKVDFITSNETNHYPRLTVQACSFTGNGEDESVAIRTKSAYGLVIEDCTGTGLHSFLQNTSGVGISISGVKVTDSKGGLALGTAQNVSISGCEIETVGYGIRLDAVLNTSAALENNKVNAYIPVVVRNATATDYDLSFTGDDNAYTASNTDGKWCVIGTEEYEEGKALPEAPVAGVDVICDEALADGLCGYTSLNGKAVVIPEGTVTFCYTGTDRFWGEAGANSENSFVIKLFEGDNQIASASLNNIGGIIDGEVYVTWNIPFVPNTDGYWTVEWAEGYPKYDMNPTAVKLFSDGVEVAENAVRFNAPDDLNKIVAIAEDTDGNIKAYTSLAEAVNSAKKVSVVRDTTLSETLTLPADITFNGNGKAITGEVWASGNVTFAGHTKVTNFNAGYNKPTITIGEGACLELTSTKDRAVIGHGATFNITGEIEDAKSATISRAVVKPSLILSQGASFTGAGVNFNVKNAYIKTSAQYSSSSKSASGTFNFNIENSIWEQFGKLAFEAQSTAATVNFNLKDSVLTTTSHLVFGVNKGKIVIDNSLVNEGVYRQLENRSDMTIKNGSVVYASVATSSNAKNPGKLTVDNAKFISTGEFTGSDLGTGTLILVNGADFTTGKLANVNATVDATSTLTATIDPTATVIQKGSTLAGAGTEDDPYIIADIFDLEFFRDSVNAGNNYAGKYVELTADIDLKGENWTPIGTSANPFNGNFNGNDKTISNLVINGSKSYVSGGNNDNYKGLFGYSRGNSTVIKNVKIHNAKVTGCLYVGALIGRAYTGATIENCHVTGEIDIDSYSYAGVIAGRYEYGAGIFNCSVKDETSNGGTVNADYAVSYVGGIVGFTSEPAPYVTIDGCNVENMTISGIYGVGGLAGISHYGVTISNAVVNKVTVISDQTGYDDTNREGNVGLIAGACQGTSTTPSVFENITVTETTGSVTNEEGTTEVKDIFGSNMTGVPAVTNYVAKVGSSYFDSLESAFKAATSGCVIELLADATISDKWDCRYNGAKFLVPVTIEGNNKTIKLTGEVDDKNWNTVFRFEDNATVRNLTIDASEATGIQRGISSKYNITVEGCTLIGNGTSAKRAIIFGEGAGSAISDVTATVIGSTFKGWSYGVSDNQSGKDAKSVSITGSKFENSSVLVSASETVTFTGNEVESGYVNISSYSVPNELSVTAKENILDTTETYAEDNTIKAKTIDAQDGFNTPVAIVAGKYYTDLQSAIDKANGSTITIVDDMTLVDTTYTIADGMAITLDLNGKKITAKENKTGNYELFYNLGELTVVGNGSIELTATVDRDWNAMSTIFHNRGGVLNLENGTFTHKGGTDMAYVVDNSGNSYGDATTNIIDANLSSTYIAIRNRMDTYGANGGGNGIATLNVTGGNIYGYKRGIWGQVSSTGAKGNINISGGSVTSVDQDAVVVGTDSTGEINTAISGGIFSSDVSAFLVEGASISKNNDGTYGVVAERTIEVSASEEEVVAGQEFTVTVKLAKGENIFNAEWTLAYDTSLFELKGADAQTGSIKEILSKTLEGQFYAEGEVLNTYTFVAKAVPAKITGSFTLSDTTASTFAESRDAVQVAATNNEKVDVTINMIEYDVTATLNGEAVDLTATTPVAETTYTGEAQEFIVSTDLPADVDCKITYTVDGKDVDEVALTDVGEYVVNYTITTADGYAEKTGTVTIKVKAPEFVVEATKWTNMGKKLVLVYTNQDAMYFTYDGKLMIDVTAKGYKYENTTEYKNVFAFVTDELANDVVDSYKEKVMYISEDEGLFILTDGHSKADVNFSNTLNVQDISVEYGIVNLHSEIYGDVKYQKHLLKGDTNSDKIVNGKDTAYVVSEVKTAMGIN